MAFGASCCPCAPRCQRPARLLKEIQGESSASVPHFLDMGAAGVLQQATGFGVREFWIARFNRDEEPVVRGQMKAGRSEQRIVEARQSIQKKHAQKRSE